MTLNQLHAVYEAQPFRPFTMHLTDGRANTVISREFILTVPSGRTVVICQPDDTLNIIDLLFGCRCGDQAGRQRREEGATKVELISSRPLPIR